MTLIMMVEIPRGSRNKYEYSNSEKRFYLDRMLFSSVVYPTDYGFIPETLAEDGDELDALVIVGEATFPGCFIRVHPVGVFEMWDEMGPDQKILCVPVSDPQWNWVKSLDDVPPHLLKEITHFFEVYKDLEKKETTVGDWLDRDAAEQIVIEAKERFRNLQKL